MDKMKKKAVVGIVVLVLFGSWLAFVRHPRELPEAYTDPVSQKAEFAIQCSKDGVYLTYSSRKPFTLTLWAEGHSLKSSAEHPEGQGKIRIFQDKGLIWLVENSRGYGSFGTGRPTFLLPAEKIVQEASGAFRVGGSRVTEDETRDIYLYLTAEEKPSSRGGEAEDSLAWLSQCRFTDVSDGTDLAKELGPEQAAELVDLLQREFLKARPTPAEREEPEGPANAPELAPSLCVSIRDASGKPAGQILVYEDDIAFLGGTHYTEDATAISRIYEILERVVRE